MVNYPINQERVADPPYFKNRPQAKLNWLPMKPGKRIPRNAVEAGPGVYVARGWFGGECLPGKAMHGERIARLPYKGSEVCVTDYEILIDNCKRFSWKKHVEGAIPWKAVIGGFRTNQRPLYIARGMLDNEYVIGKTCPEYKCALFPHNGAEQPSFDYEILVSTWGFN